MRRLIISCLIFLNCATCCADFKALNISNTNDPHSLDPHLVSSVADYKVIYGLFDGLVTLDQATLKVIPCLAERYEASEDGTKYTFYLRKDAKWTNGQNITSNDFVFSIKRVLTKELCSPNVELVLCVKNAKEYYDGEITDFSEVGVRAIGDYVLEIELKGAMSYFLSMLVTPVWFPVNEKCVLKHGDIGDRNSKWSREHNIVTNGAFKVRHWDVGSKIVLKKNMQYWDVDNVKSDIINIWSISDVTTEERLFLNEEIDITETVSFAKIKELENSDELHVEPYLGVFFYSINVNDVVLSDKIIRKAMSLVIDREKLLKILGEPTKLASNNLIPEGINGYVFEGEEVCCFEKAVEEAKELIKKSDNFANISSQKFTLMFSNSLKHKTIAEFIQASLKEHLGIDVELIGLDWKVFVHNRRAGNFDLARGGWIGDYNDATTFLGLFKTGGLQNHGKWSSREYDALLERIESENLPEKERNALIKQAEDILLEDCAIIPLFFESSHHLVSKKVRGWHDNVLDFHPLKCLEKIKDE